MSEAADRLRARRLALIGGAAAIAGAMATGAGWLRGRTQGEAMLSGPVLQGLAGHRDLAGLIRISSAGSTWTVRRTGDAWTVAERAGYPANTATLRSMLDSLTGLRRVSRRTADPARLAALGLSSPLASGGLRVEVTDSNGVPFADLFVAAESPVEAGARLVRVADEPAAILAEGPFPDLDLPRSLLDLDLLTLTPDRIAWVEARMPGEPPYRITRAPSGDITPEGGRPNPNATDAALALSDVQLRDVRPESEIGAPSRARHVTALRNGLRLIADIHAQDGIDWLRLRADGSSGPVAAAEAAKLSRRLDGWVFALSPYDANDFTLPRDSALGATLR